MSGEEVTGGFTAKPTDQHWQTHLTNVSERISYLRSSSKFADLTISFPEHKKSIKVHKMMLALSSPVFEAMMFGPLAEGEVLCLPDDPPDAFEWFLDHLYCDQRNLPSMDMAIEVFQLANKYQLTDLCRLCSEYLGAQVNADNLPLLYNMAYILEDNTLLEDCEKILYTKSDEVLQSNEIPRLSRSALKHLLESNLNPSSSLVVFKCIHTWGKAELGRIVADSSDVEGHLEAAGQSGKEVDMTCLPHSLRQCVESLLPLVDFLSMSVDEFVEHVLPTGIFTPEENMSLLQGIKSVPGIALPSCVNARAVKSMVLVDSTSDNTLKNTCERSDVSLHDFSISFCSVQTSHPIRLLQIEAHFWDMNAEGEVLVYNDVNKVVGRGIWNETCCIFQRPVDLEPGKLFRICKNTCREDDDWIAYITESDGISVTGEASDSVKKLLINYSLFHNSIDGSCIL